MIYKPVPRITTSQALRAGYSEDLKKHDRLMELLETYHKVCLTDNDSYPEKLTWCFEHCQNKFRDMKNGTGMYWYFENEKDASMFAMKWS